MYDERDKYLDNGEDFINEAEIFAKLKENEECSDKFRVRDILQKSLELETLDPDETAALVNVSSLDLIEQMQETALLVKKKVYDNRIVTFAPLYTANVCINDCKYCGFRSSNKQVQRKILSLEQIRCEVEILSGQIGHKRLIVVYGESAQTDIDYMVSSIKEIYGVKINGEVGIRRVNVNAPSMSIEKLRKLKEVGIGTYQVFQETYHRDTYAKLHPLGTPKSDYRWRLYSMHRAMEAGIDDFGIGVLFDLYDWKFEVMGLLYHTRELEKRFNVGPHTISFPRFEEAINTSLTFNENGKYKTSDEEFKKLVTVLRLAVPYTGLILTAREAPDLRREVLDLGITQIDASSKIGIGSYSRENEIGQDEKKQQFLLSDMRSLDEIISELADMGYITSFCTAAYRCGRTGEKIIGCLKNGTEGKFCKLNAVITYKEWLDDFATKETKEKCENIINQEITEIKRKYPFMYDKFMDYYNQTEKGMRDLYF